MTDQQEKKKDKKGLGSAIESLEDIIQRLSVDQIRFVTLRQEFSSDKETAEELDISPSTVKNWKYDGVPINQAVKLMVFDGLIVAAEIRRRSLAKAMLVKRAGLESDDERVRPGAATEIIEWEMGKATGRQEISGPGGAPIKTQQVALTPDEEKAAMDAFYHRVLAEVRERHTSGDQPVEEVRTEG
jgi:hypothetical protein